DRCRIGPTLMDGDFLRHPLAANGLPQESLGRVPIARGRQQEVNRVAFFVDCAIQIRPFPLNFYVGLVHPPPAPHGTLAATELLFKLRAVSHHPAIKRSNDPPLPLARPSPPRAADKKSGRLHTIVPPTRGSPAQSAVP